MDVAQLLREARQSVGISQRTLARRAGVGLRTVAGLEAGERQPSVALLDRLLAACDLSLTTARRTIARPPCRHLHEHLRLSLTERWALAARSTGRQARLERALATAQAGGRAVLEPAAAVPMWVPGVEMELPVVATFHPAEGLDLSPRRPRVDHEILVLRHAAGRAPEGLIRVRVTGLVDVHVWHPAVLAREQSCKAWSPGLEAAASLLHEVGARDGAGRRAPAHRQPDEDEEARRLAQALRYVGLPRPSSRDSRAFRIGGPASLPQWLAERGLPPLRGQRERW